LRWLRDWATCLQRSGYDSIACEVRLGPGANYRTVLERTGTPLVNELVCNEPRCTDDLGRSLEHCQKKFTYQDACTLDDWDAVWWWLGDPPLPITGWCANATGDVCTSSADCSDGAPCQTPSSCDVYKYGPAAWEPCRCIQEVFIKPQLDDWLAAVREIDPAPTAGCAAAAFNTMGEAIGPMIEAGCMDPNDDHCLAAVNRCEEQWAATALRNQCHTCPLGADSACPERCDEAQIPCATWMSWCAAAKVRFDPLRRATRQLPGAW
jgi:hypothetical protein